MTGPTGIGRDPARPNRTSKRNGPMEQVIDTLASGLGSTVARLAEAGVLFAVFAIVWIAFAVALIWSQGSLDQAWEWTGSLPIILQAVIWVLFLPVMVGLWVWETSWPLVVRLALVIGIAGWNLFMFLPRALVSR